MIAKPGNKTTPSWPDPYSAGYQNSSPVCKYQPPVCNPYTVQSYLYWKKVLSCRTIQLSNNHSRLCRTFRINLVRSNGALCNSKQSWFVQVMACCLLRTNPLPQPHEYRDMCLIDVLKSLNMPNLLTDLVPMWPIKFSVSHCSQSLLHIMSCSDDESTVWLNTLRLKQNGCQFPWWHFQMHFLEWKCMNFDWDFTEVCSLGFSWQYSSIGSDNGLAPTRRQAIIWTNGG